jgi:predicted nucleic acid-binding protein
VVLVDANVLLDVFTVDARWYEWSSSALERCAEQESIAINPLVYAECSPRFKTIEELEEALPPLIERLSLPWEAAFLAGRSFVEYRRRGGAKSAPLPDFFIGAHALLGGMRLLTRDSKRYRSYFPKLRLIAPAAQDEQEP